MKFRYRSEEFKTPEEEPFKNDKLGREPFVTQVTELLAVIQEPFVIALNAPWGSGKTTTFKLLERQLEAKKFTTVSFNAWEVDYSTDPLVPLVATLHERLLDLRGVDPSLTPETLDKFKTLAGKVLKHGAIAAVKIVTAGAVDAGTLAEGIAEGLNSASEDVADHVIDSFKREKDAAEQFRKLLEEITAKVRKETEDGKEPPPVVLLIDELDRCRPTFAVAMLERIKHFFSVPGLVFVLALDLEQLKASTRKVYGAEMDAVEYLRRFIDLELRLPRADVGAMVRGMLSSCGADAFFAERAQHRAFREEYESVITVITSLTSNFDLTPRVVQRMISRLMLVLRQTRSNGYLFPILTVFMIFLRMRDEELLRSLVARRISAQDVMAAVRQFHSRGKQFCESHVGSLIEAYLLFAQVDLWPEAHKKNFFQQVMAIQEKKEKSPQEHRVLEIHGYYQRVSSEYFHTRIDLKALDQRINLVSSDFTEEH